ncbi:Multidrug efflux pump subunit [Halomicronema hongdechloris C2206]|uniref:Multidrug efflux pump subunit n=1 Tax=Halomicronema hongdechloris C2206 TaxID=1641165 RepID=A0A1Z3HPH1_9CYAN|nr:efflux RND transporter periplasmic adaptor subunit [Halomicronema hongdechloris]ASC72201.1 Multidrug efflux pump subunit [Halomicronema hongdechloris C2206]
MVPSSSSSSYSTAIDATDTEDHAAGASPWSPRRHPWLALGGLVLLMAGMGFLGWRWWLGRQGASQTAGMGQSQGIPVKLETLTTAPVRDYTEFIGALESRQSVVLRPEVSGRVVNIYINNGDRVTTGTPLIQLKPDQAQADLASRLATVNSARAQQANARSEIEALRAERIAQQAELELQQEDYTRIAQLVEQGALPQQELDRVERDRNAAQANLEAIERRIQAAQATLEAATATLEQAQANANRAQADLQATTVKAPFDGIVGDIPVRLGDVVSSNDILTSLTQNLSLDLRLSVPIEQAPDLRLGQPVELTDNQGNRLGAGQISFISPTVDSDAQTILAKATFANGDGRLRNGQFVRARLIWQEQPGLTIPATAVSRIAGEPFVFVAASPESSDGPDLIARQRSVSLGDLKDNRYQVLSGLAAGDQVVVSGILNLSDGAPIMPQTTSANGATP